MDKVARIFPGMLAAALLLGGLAGCGNKGPLVMPARPAPAVAPEPPVAPAQVHGEPVELPADVPADVPADLPAEDDQH